MTSITTTANAATTPPATQSTTSAAYSGPPIQGLDQFDPATQKLIEADVQAEVAMANKYDIQPRLDAAAATTSFTSAWTNLQQSIAKQRPDLANANYDFVLNNGAFQVVSTTLSAKDQQWLNTQLNGNKQMLAAATQFTQAVATYYDTTDDPIRHGWVSNQVTADQRQYATLNQQLQGGAIPFRDLLATIGQISATGGMDPSVVDSAKASTRSQLGIVVSGYNADFSIDAAEKYLKASAIQTVA